MRCPVSFASYWKSFEWSWKCGSFSMTCALCFTLFFNRWVRRVSPLSKREPSCSQGRINLCIHATRLSAADAPFRGKCFMVEDGLCRSTTNCLTHVWHARPKQVWVGHWDRWRSDCYAVVLKFLCGHLKVFLFSCISLWRHKLFSGYAVRLQPAVAQTTDSKWQPFGPCCPLTLILPQISSWWQYSDSWIIRVPTHNQDLFAGMCNHHGNNISKQLKCSICWCFTLSIYKIIHRGC